MIGATHIVTVIQWDKDLKQFKTFTVSPCTWIRSRKAVLSTNGYFKRMDTVISRMPITKESKTIQKGDLIVLGDVKLGNGTRSFGDIKNEFPDHLTVTGINVSDIGSAVVNHIKIEGE